MKKTTTFLLVSALLLSVFTVGANAAYLGKEKKIYYSGWYRMLTGGTGTSRSTVYDKVRVCAYSRNAHNNSNWKLSTISAYATLHYYSSSTRRWYHYKTHAVRYNNNSTVCAQQWSSYKWRNHRGVGNQTFKYGTSSWYLPTQYVNGGI